MNSKLTIIAICFQLSVCAQTYKLVPDSCTFCFYGTSTGGNSWYMNNYGIDPFADTLLYGNSYMKLSGMDSPFQPFAIRQSGNKLFGVVQDSVAEFLIMDFDALPSDTIYNLYSEGYKYHAIVLQKDSNLVNGGIYHHYMRLQGFQIFLNDNWEYESWSFKWGERGLCWTDIIGTDWDYGGVLYNIPMHQYTISVPYINPSFCTLDTIYDNQFGNTCFNCVPISGTNSIFEFSLHKNKDLVRVVNVLGQDTENEINTVHIYVYSDGTTEKVFRLE